MLALGLAKVVTLELEEVEKSTLEVGKVDIRADAGGLAAEVGIAGVLVMVVEAGQAMNFVQNVFIDV
ncbi:hypothetical protein M5689_007972 [Euphorbia peplus]|nr:hypothetical protein M5689_007972 [Euphorbia peplus]